MWFLFRSVFLAMLLSLPALAEQVADSGRDCHTVTMPVESMHLTTDSPPAHAKTRKEVAGCEGKTTEGKSLETCKPQPECTTGSLVFDSVPQLGNYGMVAQVRLVMPDTPSPFSPPQTLWRPPRRA